jgi:hypothetical protein
MLTRDQITEIFCFVDDFCSQINDFVSSEPFFDAPLNLSLVDFSKYALHPSEVITLLICFHHSGFRSLKSFYNDFAKVYLINDFPRLPSYGRFVELQSMSLFHNYLFTKFYTCSPCDGISFIDSFRLPVCYNRWIHQHKVFDGLAQRGHTSMGYFYGFKGHIVINSKCQIVDFQITTGNVADNDEQTILRLCSNIFGKVYGDKGYIMNQEKMNKLLLKGIHFVTKIRSNMKNKLVDIKDKFMLKRRAIVETVIDQLKNICHIEHTRHRSPVNFYNNFLSAIAAYAFKPIKPTLRKSKKQNRSFNPFQLQFEF